MTQVHIPQLPNGDAQPFGAAKVLQTATETNEVLRRLIRRMAMAEQ